MTKKGMIKTLIVLLLFWTGLQYFHHYVANRRSQTAEAMRHQSAFQPEAYKRTKQLERKANGEIVLPRHTNSSAPVVLFYNTHPHEQVASTEAFWDGDWNNYHNTGLMDVVEMSHFLATILAEHNIAAMVENRDVTDLLQERGWDYNYSYKGSREFVLERMNEHKTLQFFFDVHRDGGPPESGRTTIDGISYATIMFIVGSDNPEGYEENLAMAQQLTAMLEKKRPGITRPVRLSGGYGNNGVYNQDLAPTAQLFEVGTVDTTIEEVTNSLQVVGEVIAQYILQQMQ